MELETLDRRTTDSRLEMKFKEFENEKSMVEHITEEILENLYKAYVKMPDKKMNKSQLHEVFINILNQPISAEEFDGLYEKMNSMRDEGINWDELLSYFLLEFLVKGMTVPTSHSFELPIIGLPEIINSRHRSFICRIIFSPEISSNTVQNKASNYTRGCYLTAGRDGVINYWSIDFNHQRRVEQNLQLRVRCMITDIIAMPDVKMICLSSSARNLRFYDTAVNKFELRIKIHNFEDIIVCMNYYQSPGKLENLSCIVLGDTGGSVKFITFNPVDRGPFKQHLKRNVLHVHYDTVLKDGVRGLKLKEFNHIHTDWVSQVNYYGKFRAFISCSRCPKCSLLLCDPTGLKIKYSFKVEMGISCFTLDEEKKLLFTGGRDCLVRIWNPIVSNKSNAVLRGHRATICAILSLNNDGHLFTLSKDRCIKIWDVVSQTCIQTYNRLPSELSERTPMSVIYNSSMQKIIIASMMIAILTYGKVIDKDLSDGETHTQQVTRVLYNPLFKVIVTTGADSRIIIWDPWHARRINVLSNAHDQLNYLNDNVHVEITAATFDYSYQLLITGGRNGTLKVWNFNTCLRSMSIENKCEISNIIWLENRIICAGWNRIIEFADIHDGIYRKVWRKRHSDDILCTAVRYPQAFATGSHNGELVLWYLETGQPYKTYNVLDIADKDSRSNQEGKKNKVVAWKEIDDKSRNDQSTFGFIRTVAVRAVLFLCTRQMGPKIGTLIVSLNSGLIQMWSHHPVGGFLKAFSAIHIDGDCCLSLTTDPANDFLITGHKEGYIKVWLMKNYEVGIDSQEKINMAALKLQFPFLWEDRILGRAKRATKDQPLPILVSSHKGHLKPINCIEFIPGANLIITGSSDHTARMWTLYGRYISTLGSFKEWNIILPDVPINNYFEDYEIPPDVKKIASSTTMKVLTGGIISEKLEQIDETQKVKKVLPDEKDEYVLYGERIDESLIEIHKFASYKRFHENPRLDNSMAYIPVYTHLNTYNLATIEKKNYEEPEHSSKSIQFQRKKKNK